MSSASCSAITGGCGYIGLRLARFLLEKDPSSTVLLLDICPPSIELDTTRLIYHHCDIRNARSVNDALASATCVYHLASYGMSGREVLNSPMIYDVNVVGTENILQACRQHGIAKVIFCSTYNTIYTGQRELIDVTEDQCSYPEQRAYFDEYSRTKALAEQAVLKANSPELSTAIIRPAAIYGDGEGRHLPRILTMARQGLAFFSVGDPTVRCDWVYADNLVSALVLAEESLPKHAGEVYFISDDQPVNNFQFLSQLTQGLGYESCFTLSTSTTVMFYLAFAIELIHGLLARYIYDFAPFFTRTEVLKVGITHYANIAKAKQLLNYRVQVDPQQAMQRCIHWFDQRGYRKQTAKDTHVFYTCLMVGSLVISLIICMLIDLSDRKSLFDSQ